MIDVSANQTRTVRFAGAGGVSIAGEVLGDSSAQPVILLHGGGQTRRSWRSLASSLANGGWHVLSLDLRGHGESDWSPVGDYTLEAFVDDLASVAGLLGRPPIFVGASLGGLAALTYMGEAATPVAAALVLVDITPRPDPAGAARIAAFMRAHPDGFASIDAAADAVASYLPHRPRPSSAAGLRSNLRRDPDGRYRWHWDPRFLDGDQSISLPPERLEAAARRIMVPTLLVRGFGSEIVSDAVADEFRMLVPHAEHVVVPKASHMVAGDSNDAFEEAVVGFLLSRAPPGDRRDGS